MPREDATVMDKIASDRDSLKSKLVTLTAQLAETEGLKKSATKGFNDSIKDIKAEIKMTLDLLKKEDENEQNTSS